MERITLSEARSAWQIIKRHLSGQGDIDEPKLGHAFYVVLSLSPSLDGLLEEVKSAASADKYSVGIEACLVASIRARGDEWERLGCKSSRREMLAEFEKELPEAPRSTGTGTVRELLQKLHERRPRRSSS